jgi:hypothetical protein
MKISIAVSILLLAGVADAQDDAECPHRAGHRAAVDHRHDQVSGVGHEESVHHFLIGPKGGTIRLETRGAGDTVARDRIRAHLQVVARSFARGDFALPMFIHDQTPPGVDVMKSRKGAIRYVYAATERGGEVRISTDDPEALAAVQAFLRFQIDDHGTGDPKE